MKVKEIIKYLNNYQKWRRGADLPMPNPKELGIAIDGAIRELRYARPQTKPRKRGVPSHERRGTHGTAHIRGVETYRKPTAANGSNADYQRSRGSRRP